MGLIIAVLDILAAITSRQLADEFKAWTPRIIERLIKRAVQNLPEEQRERCEEEWSAHVCDTPGEIGKLIAALGFLRAARAMSSEVTKSSRVFDILFATILLSFCGPLFFGLVIVIKAESRGPIFVKRSAKGLKGRTVSLLIFRTSLSGDSPHWTRVGWYLLRLRLDELPMLINVICGDIPLPAYWRPLSILRGS
jgi:Bacterial sugar transferase